MILPCAVSRVLVFLAVTQVALLEVLAAPAANVTRSSSVTPQTSSTTVVSKNSISASTSTSSSKALAQSSLTVVPSASSPSGTHSLNATSTSTPIGNASTVIKVITTTAPKTSTFSSYAPAPTGALPSGYIQTSGTKFVSSSGSEIHLRGTNLGGWLVMEDWMDGITDSTDTTGTPKYRQARRTLTARFGAGNAATLIDTWEANFVNAADFTEMKALGFNVVRIPFSYLTLQNLDGSWRSDAFTRLDWAVSQASSNQMYVILSFHVWDTQFVNYNLISQNSNEGAAARVEAEAIWVKVAQHYLNNPTIAAFDVINEPTGSFANYLPRALYSAVRSVDAHRVIILESYGGLPSTYGWNQVAYSFHEYKMEGPDLSANEAIWAVNRSLIQQYQSIPVPFYMGEFMASNDTLSYLLGQMNSLDVAWSSWTWKAVDMNGWAFYNYPHYPVTYRVNINNDTYDHILSTWQGLSQIAATRNTALVAAFTPYINV